MIYVLYGTDTIKSRAKLTSLINTLLTKKPDAMLMRTDAEHFTEEFVSEYVESQGLFEQKSIIVFDMVFEDKVYKEILLKKLKELQRSDNVFIFLEGKMEAKALQKFEKYASKIQECSLPKTKDNKSGFNIFELSDALGVRNRKKMWVMYQEGKTNNISDEEMHGILFWGVKNMILSKTSSSAQEAGLSPFVYKKATSQASKYSLNELIKLSQNLVRMYHESRRGVTEFSVAFERFILELK